MELPTAYYAQTGAFSLGVLGLIFFGFRRIRVRRQASHAIFSWIFLPVFLNILLEPMLGLASGRPGACGGALLRAVIALCYALQPVPMALWIAFLCATVQREAKLSGFQWAFIALPLGINLILALFSLKFDLMFSVGEGNVYHRGPHFWLLSALCYSYLLYYFYYAFANRKRMLHREFEVFFLGALPMVLAGVLQSMFQGLFLIWPAATFTMLIFYQHILIRQAHTDHLTGLANRRRFDNQLKAALESDDTRTALILIDIDNFKSINDQYGHLMGDRALEAVGGALTRGARKTDLVARIGGDEFAMLAEVAEPQDLDRVTARVRENLRTINQRPLFPFVIEASVGVGCCDRRAGLCAEEFMHLIDNRMYEEKRANQRRVKGAEASPEVQLLKI
jgi:diguanylate cyclase (GGDEF)-like protein